MNMNITFPRLWDPIFFKDFSRPGNNNLQIPGFPWTYEPCMQGIKRSHFHYFPALLMVSTCKTKYSLDVHRRVLQLNKHFIEMRIKPTIRARWRETSAFDLLRNPGGVLWGFSTSYHDGVGEVAIGLALQTHGGELGCHIALRGGLVQGGLPDPGHLSGHEEGQHALQQEKGSGRFMSSGGSGGGPSTTQDYSI